MSNAGKWLDVKNPMYWLQSDDDTAKVEYSMLMLTNGKEFLFVTLFCRSFEEALVQILRKAIRTKQQQQKIPMTREHTHLRFAYTT